MKNKRWSEIDVLYAIGTVLVVLGHSHSSDWSTFYGTILDPMLTFIYVFHMPLFFFIAGFLFRNSNSLEKSGYGVWIKQKAERLMIPYVVLSVGALIPKYVVENSGFQDFTINYLLKAVLAPRVGVWGHFWFLPVLTVLYMVFGILGKRLKKKEGFSVWIILFAISIILYFLPYSTYWLGFSDLKKAVLFFVLGMFVNEYMKKNQRQIERIYRVFFVFLGVLISMILTKCCYGIKSILLLTAIIMISVCWQMAVLIGENKICRWISNYNFTIYIYAWPFQAVVMILAGRLNFPWYMTTLSMFSTGIIAPLLLVLIYKKLKILNNRFFDLVLGIK